MSRTVELQCHVDSCDRRATHELLPRETRMQAIGRLIHFGGWGYNLPRNQATCPGHMAELRAEARNAVGYIEKARSAIIATGLDAGTLSCPKCGGDLDFTVSPCNGHVHAMCRTSRCLAWME